MSRAAFYDQLEPTLDRSGRPRPWDLEYGFAGGRLWLFQTRPFIGNESIKNVPALAEYERKPSDLSQHVSLDAPLPKAPE